MRFPRYGFKSRLKMRAVTKRYLLFMGDKYYPSQAWEDYKGDFATPEAAMSRVMNLDPKEHSPDWYQIVDTKTSQIVQKGETTGFYDDRWGGSGD